MAQPADARIIGQLVIAFPFGSRLGAGIQMRLQPGFGIRHHAADLSAFEWLAVPADPGVAEKAGAAIAVRKTPQQQNDKSKNRQQQRKTDIEGPFAKPGVEAERCLAESPRGARPL